MINYVLGLAVAFALVTGLFVAGEQFVSDQREESIRTELEVLGEQVAADMMRADRLARTTEGHESVRVRRTLPSRVGGTQYAVSITGGSDPYVLLEARSPDVTVEAPFATETTVEMSDPGGRQLVVNYTDAGTLALEDQEAR